MEEILTNIQIAVEAIGNFFKDVIAFFESIGDFFAYLFSLL